MLSTILELLPLIVELLVVGLGALGLSILGLFIEQFAVRQFEMGHQLLSGWALFIGGITLGFAYLLFTDKLPTTLAVLRQRLNT